MNAPKFRLFSCDSCSRWGSNHPIMAATATDTSPHLQHLVHLSGKSIKVLLGQKLALSLGDSASGFLHQGARLPLTVHLRGGVGRTRDVWEDLLHPNTRALQRRADGLPHHLNMP